MGTGNQGPQRAISKSYLAGVARLEEDLCFSLAYGPQGQQPNVHTTVFLRFTLERRREKQNGIILDTLTALTVECSDTQLYASFAFYIGASTRKGIILDTH